MLLPHQYYIRKIFLLLIIDESDDYPMCTGTKIISLKKKLKTYWILSDLYVITSLPRACMITYIIPNKSLKYNKIKWINFYIRWLTVWAGIHSLWSWPWSMYSYSHIQVWACNRSKHLIVFRTLPFSLISWCLIDTIFAANSRYNKLATGELVSIFHVIICKELHIF